jgi:hypothetical protein
VNHPPATLFDQFLKERVYLKNVTPRTLIWYRVAFKNFRDSLAPGAPTLPTKSTLQQFVVQLRDRGIRPATCNTYLGAMNAFCAWLYEVQLTYAASARKLTPTARNVSRSIRSRRRSSASIAMRHNKAAPELTSIKLSTPNPTREMLPASAPAPTATNRSRLFHPIVKYSSRRLRCARAARSIVVITSLRSCPSRRTRIAYGIPKAEALAFRAQGETTLGSHPLPGL